MKTFNHNLIVDQPKKIAGKKGTSAEDNSCKAKNEYKEVFGDSIGGPFLHNIQTSNSNESSVSVSCEASYNSKSSKTKKTKKNNVLRKILKKLQMQKK